MEIDDLPQWHFGEDEETANETLAQILDGRKRMTSSTYYPMEEGADLPLEEQIGYPKAGDINVVTDWEGVPKCVIKTTAVSVMAYVDVPFEIARLEQGDETLEDWQISRGEVFRNELDYLLDGNTRLFLEIFEVVEYL